MGHGKYTSHPLRFRSRLHQGGWVMGWLLAGISLFLALWIVVPAPTRFLLPLGVGAPEISPGLVVLSAIALTIAFFTRAQGQPSPFPLSLPLVCSALALVLSLLPWGQLPAANHAIAAEMGAVLGVDYLAQVPPESQARWRSRPFRWREFWGGIPIPPVSIQRGIVFAEPDGVPLTLNLYRPSPTGTHPTLVVIYGGAWQGGSPASHESFSRYIAAQGYTVVAIDYRHAPQYVFPAQIEDVNTALAYVQTHAEALGVDRTRLAVMGRSAGAQLAAISAYDPDQPLSIKAVITYYGPVDLAVGYEQPPRPDPIDTRAVLRAFLGGTPDQVPGLYRQASPLHAIRPQLPPTLLVYAGRDHVVQARFGRQLYRQLQAAGNQAVWLEVPWAEHAFDILFNGIGNQLALYYTERFLAWALSPDLAGELPPNLGIKP